MSVIKAENIGKKYVIGHEKPRHTDTLRAAITELGRGLWQRLSHPLSVGGIKTESEEFWALKNIDFEIASGDRIGLIGSNGAGKSTLLKILSRITAPTTGIVNIKGRVACLLEVGTGFHPELSGRENIYLNGAILGMKKSEINRKFDEIVSFAEVERFLDTPVKRYSSGMYVRLAFSIAAHLEPDILIVDEVLAVGDAAFQKKCLGKMGDVGDGGRTVIFVSHNLNAVQQLCDSAMYLKHGTLVDHVKGADKVCDLVSRYHSETLNASNMIWVGPDSSVANPWFQPEKLYLSDEHGNVLNEPVRKDSTIWVCVEGMVEKLSRELSLGYVLYDEYGSPVYISRTTDTPEDLWPNIATGKNCFRSAIPHGLLNEGRYSLRLVASVASQKNLFRPSRDAVISVEFEVKGGLSQSPLWLHRRIGVVAPEIKWESEAL